LHVAEQLAEIGIVLLLFGVGLHFSIEDFMEVKKIASIGAITRIGIVGALGLCMSYFFDWGLSTGIIVGLSLSVASTVVLLRTFEEKKLLGGMSGKISIGWLIVEDVVMVLALVMLPAIISSLGQGASGSFSFGMLQEIGVALGKMLLFGLLMLVAGRRFLPWLLTTVTKTGSSELFTLAAISMAMGIAFGATILFGVSLALGAFFAGMMIRESDLNHEVANRILPFQDAFSVLFFVSVGMLFSPMVLIEHPLEVVLVVLIIVPIKALVTYAIVSTFGYPRRKVVLTSLGLAQIGEFSFILLGLGTSLNVINSDAKDFILAGALISIAVNPFLVSWGDRATRSQDFSNRENDDVLCHLEPEQDVAPHPKLSVIVGCGRVGTHLIDMMKNLADDIIVIEDNREKVESLRADGIAAIAGDATQPEILEHAHISEAKNVLITLPDPFAVRRVAELVRTINKDARILVRSHNDEETEYFKSTDVDLSVSGTEEIAKRMVAHLYPF
jgi:CPA2 family monovalent cation:H+ antiporter-2